MQGASLSKEVYMEELNLKRGRIKEMTSTNKVYKQ
jgi:hypothetical protein